MAMNQSGGSVLMAHRLLIWLSVIVAAMLVAIALISRIFLIYLVGRTESILLLAAVALLFAILVKLDMYMQS